MAPITTTLQTSSFANKHHICHFSSYHCRISFFVPAIHTNKPSRTRPISATSQDTSSSDSPKPTTTSNNSDPPPPNSDKPISPGQDFGSLNPAPATAKKGGKRGKANVIRRRPPVEKPVFLSGKDEVEAKERAQNESAFLLVWLGLGGLIITEGIILAASGLLPEKWDKFFVKYLYPSFTPTVGLFIAGTVVYGVAKYLQNENANNKNTQK